jgi:hypothetical protein
MATWRAIRSSSLNRNQETQSSIEHAFRANGFTATSLGRARAPFRGACSPPCTFSILLMIEGAVAPPPCKGFTLRRPVGATPKWHKFPGLPKWSPEIASCGVPGL